MPDLHLLTGAYALDALDDVERAGFERHLRTCRTCPLEVREFQESAAGLADRVAVPPPPFLRDRVLREVSRTRQLSPAGRRVLPNLSLRRSLAVAAAAVVLAGGAGLGGIAWQGQRSAHDHEAEAARIAQIVTDPSRREVVGKPTGGGTADVIAARGSAVFAAAQFSSLPSDRTYQLWVIRGKVIRSLGLLHVTDGTGQELVSGVRPGDTVAVSVEPSGGSKQPTTTPVLALPVT